jgi:hypothetical protein
VATTLITILMNYGLLKNNLLFPLSILPLPERIGPQKRSKRAGFNNDKMKKYILSISLLTTLLLGGCGDQSSFLTNVLPADGAKVKFVHAAPDAPGVAIFVNDKKVSGVLTVAPTTPGVVTYGGVFPAQDYAVLTAGASKVKVTTPTAGDATLISGDVNLESGKYYTVVATGLAPTYAPYVVQDNLPDITGNKVFIRVINLTANSTDAEVSINGSIAATGIKPKEGGDKFIAYDLPGYTSGSVTIPVIVKLNGNSTATTTGTITNTLATISFTGVTPGRVLTVITRGLLATQDKDAAGKIVVTASKYVAGVSSYTNR